MWSLNDLHWNSAAFRGAGTIGIANRRGWAGSSPFIGGAQWVLDLTSNCACKNCSKTLTNGCGEKPIITTAEWLIANSYIDANIDRKQLRVAVHHSQDLLEDYFGKPFMDILYSWTMDNTVTSAFDIQEVIEQFVNPAIGYKVQAELAVPLSFKERNQGVVTISGQDFQQSVKNDVAYLKQYYDDKFNYYLNRLNKKLRCEGIKCSCHLLGYKTNIVL